MSDEVMACTECGSAFTWSDGEQRYYRERGLDRPKRCPACRARRKAEARPADSGRIEPPPEVSRPSAQGQREVGGVSRVGRPRSAVGATFRFGVVTGAAAIALALLLALGLALDGLLSWLIAINIVTLLAYGYDKAIAGSEHTRAPERVLLALALVGGSVGAWVGMTLFHHKTAKASFQRKFWVVVVVQVILVVLYYAFLRK